MSIAQPLTLHPQRNISQTSKGMPLTFFMITPIVRNIFYELFITSGFATTHVVVPGHCNENCFENISDANKRQNQLQLE